MVITVGFHVNYLPRNSFFSCWGFRRRRWGVIGSVNGLVRSDLSGQRFAIKWRLHPFHKWASECSLYFQSAQ